MARAVRLARLGLYTTEPNPRVGCVLVRGGEIVGEGFHRRAGLPHAERIALAAAGERARGATAHVTLEPCCHQGKTPPCTEGLLEAGVSRVVAAMRDPNPLVAGKGLEILHARGLEVQVGVLEAQARDLNPGFIKRMESGLPYVRCKLAASLDGRTAMASGESKWITSDAARRDVQLLRARSSAIVTGVGTLLADDPSMNVRLPPRDLPGVEPNDAVRQPLRVVVDTGLRTLADARMLSLPGRTLIACVDQDPVHAVRLESAGALVYVGAENEGRVDLESLFRHLAREEINEILVEAGPTLAGAVLTAGLVDELVIYLAPHLMGDGARGLFSLPGLERMKDRVELKITDLRMVGPDLRVTAQPAARGQQK
ncbi:MAG: bifunctional diaminohydroxyphosphoribosylaminopyrimidine deaminase/5-amino-6-(5-phosphoribosylamino)uracil reductase RibD [Pseudomonadota bacterium]|nr:bifunctional diaminohydroxyphosphoribosylaminopyrimidine deaminase/5-amino-6-(5-phosphoribosylamino)uracil reductase RibD [Pseudomonadota bacterium]